MPQVPLAARLALAVVILAAGGCAHTPGVDPALNQTSLVQSKTAVGIMQMGIPGEGCNVATIHLGRRVGNDFELVEKLRFLPVPGSAGDAAQFELPSGEYHIVGWTCDRSIGRKYNVIHLGKLVGWNRITGTGGRYTESYGVFTLAVGEVVNLGYVRLARTASLDFQLEVTDLDAKQHAKLAQEKPQLAAQMVNRFVKLSGIRLTTQVLRQR